MSQVYRTDLLESALQEMCSKLQGVQGAVIVSIEGFVVAAYSPRESEMDEEGPGQGLGGDGRGSYQAC